MKPEQAMFYAASYTWPNLNYISATDAGDAQAEAFAERLADATAAKAPEVPPPIWDTRPIDADRCRDATRAMCGGGV